MTYIVGLDGSGKDGLCRSSL